MGGILPNDYADLSRYMSHALRHEPWIYELELDEEGWTSVDLVLEAFRGLRPEWSGLERSDFEKVIEHSSKSRHQLKGDSIRSLYGHSVPGRLRKDRTKPPRFLYHGTSPDIVDRILIEGLRPMRRQYVHLSSDKNTAYEVARRKSESPTILKISALESDICGNSFYKGNEKVWLVDEVAPEFISIYG